MKFDDYNDEIDLDKIYVDIPEIDYSDTSDYDDEFEENIRNLNARFGRPRNAKFYHFSTSLNKPIKIIGKILATVFFSWIVIGLLILLISKISSC